MMYQGSARYHIDHAMLHCAAIKTGQFDGWSPYQVFAEINRWHKERRPAFKYFGYHGLFMPDGFFFAGRPTHEIGAGCSGVNRGVLHYLMIESREITHIAQSPLEWFKPLQIEAVKAHLQGMPGVDRVTGHNDHANRLCPGFKVRTNDWL